jgi:poly(A) polymerase
MTVPVVVPRAEHSISRSQIDADALKVLYRLHQNEYVAYLVGGSVRDLLLGRRPKDFDIGTSAHPYQVKRLFRNCWIIGRRFRLAHVKFGLKTIEVATFRRQVSAEELALADAQAEEGIPLDADSVTLHDRLVHRDNTFGTPEEDAFRRDFTVNALFYDIGSFSIIDYTGGLDDLRAGVIRSIGNPLERFQEDPVRMLRAVTMAARLDFSIDTPIDAAIAAHRGDIARAAPARLMDEFYKLLRTGAAERAFRMLTERRLLEPIATELQKGAADPLWRSLAALDAYRKRFDDSPDTLSNAILLGSLLVPLGLMDSAHRRYGISEQWYPALGRLPIARKDVERLTQLIAIQPRLQDIDAPVRTQHALMHRSIFREALTWLEIYGDDPAIVRHWHAMLNDPMPSLAPDGQQDGFDNDPRRRRRRRRRRRPYRAGLQT